MPKLNRFLLFFLLATLIFIILYALLSYSGGEENCLEFLRNTFRKTFNTETQVAIFESNNDYSNWDTKLIVYQTDIFPNGEFQYYSTKYLSYISILMFISLVLASPISWFRKFVGFFIGIILMLVYSNIMAGLIVRKLAYKVKDLAEVEYSQFFHDFNAKLFEIFIEHGFEWMGLIPFVFWFITTIKLSDFGITLANITNQKIVKKEDTKTTSKTRKKNQGKIKQKKK
jgi:hypothetical protein